MDINLEPLFEWDNTWYWSVYDGYITVGFGWKFGKERARRKAERVADRYVRFGSTQEKYVYNPEV